MQGLDAHANPSRHVAGILIYSATCPKCRFLRRVLGALDFHKVLRFYPWHKARLGVLLNWFERVEDIPYQFFFISPDTSLDEGSAALPLIITALLSSYASHPPPDISTQARESTLNAAAQDFT